MVLRFTLQSTTELMEFHRPDYKLGFQLIRTVGTQKSIKIGTLIKICC